MKVKLQTGLAAGRRWQLNGELILKVGFGFLGDGGENGEELVGFVLQAGKPSCGDNVSVGEEFQPIKRFLQFFKTIA